MRCLSQPWGGGRPGTTLPRSVSAVCLVMLFRLLCNCATSWAITSPLALLQGPRPMRSRALMAGWPPAACVLRYARQVRPRVPAASASLRQCSSAPARPPVLAPLPGPLLVMK